MNFPSVFQELTEYLRIGCEIGILTFLIYSLLLFVRGTRAVTILVGITIVMMAVGLLSRGLGLEVLDWILVKMWALMALGALIVFQPEIRRALAELGSQQTRLRLYGAPKREKEVINILLEATFFLADHRIGALVAIEQNIGTRAYAETGTPINAPVSAKLLSTLFFPSTPLHDGGVIIRNGRIIAAGCIFPLAQNPDLNSSLGTRHRAAVGLTEETDALAIIVSEESGAVSLAHRGRLIRGINRARLARHLTNYLVKRRLNKSRGLIRRPITELNSDLQEQSTVGEGPIAL
ncbi:MAG: TIGR00159 family protein [Lentisphaerae bacterium]|jgi:diadenylate cyclase|nr:TIGR00159 family protein [Lentisphaerota bacterium]MBT4822380.1 TIGR00159 family protein [Lentisphaerota bacterium]MBT5609218.1 TIGR00159 family protein [Lentisphaerota bacterium]MBT7059903.1 TIGR00159 family protein [Lentisphaerota bacterium]MBT7847136.1 TIGR00159 family protein [Lentisphaerota bacterium]